MSYSQITVQLLQAFTIYRNKGEEKKQRTKKKKNDEELIYKSREEFELKIRKQGTGVNH